MNMETLQKAKIDNSDKSRVRNLKNLIRDGLVLGFNFILMNLYTFFPYTNRKKNSFKRGLFMLELSFGQLRFIFTRRYDGNL